MSVSKGNLVTGCPDCKVGARLICHVRSRWSPLYPAHPRVRRNVRRAKSHAKLFEMTQQDVDLTRDQRAPYDTTTTSSLRSVAGAGSGESAEIRARTSGLSVCDAASKRRASCSMFLAPMIGAVTWGCEATHATASVAGWIPSSEAIEDIPRV